MMSLATLFFASTERTPGAPALVDEATSLSYAELGARVRRMSDALRALEVSSLGRVAILLEKSVDAAAMILAVVDAGAIFVPVNPKLKAEQIGHILADSGAEILVCSSHRLATLGALPATLRRALVLDDGPEDATLPATTLASLRGADTARVPRHRRIDSDPAAILYTSGSTGAPKGVTVTHRNLVVGCQSVVEYLELTREDTILALLPLSFDAGLSQLSTGLAVGAKVVLHTPLRPQSIAQAIARHRVTAITAVPPLWSLVAEADWTDVDARGVRLIANTGGHMNGPLLARLRAIFTQAEPFLMYGLTEAFRSTYLDPAEVRRRPDSIGKAIPNAEILVLREDGTPCDPGEPGELVHRGPLVTLGYWNAPERTAQRFKPHASTLATGLAPEMAVWSGDIVRRDEEGFLYFIGRRDEMLKTSGYRISPTEIESVVAAAPGVREVIAMGRPAGDIGDALFAIVVPFGPDFSPALVDAHCERTLPRYMVPSLVVVDELPRSPNGKIDRAALRTLLPEVRS